MKRSNNADRLYRAEVFEKKSEESILAALECLEKGRYRSACNRAYYAVYQGLNATFFMWTDTHPQDDHGKPAQNWGHSKAPLLLDDLLNRTSLSESKKEELYEIVKWLKKFRSIADYRIQEDKKIHRDTAAARAKEAQEVLQDVLKAVGAT